MLSPIYLEYSMVSFSFPPLPFAKLFVVIVTAGMMRHDQEPQSKRVMTPAGHQSHCRTSRLVSTTIHRKEGQISAFGIFNHFKYVSYI